MNQRKTSEAMGLMRPEPSIFVFHLRGNQRTSGELSRREGGKIFGSGSRAPIAITVLVKNQNAAEHGRIWLHDIGDYLSQKEKLTIIRDFGSINGIAATSGWTQITPNEQNDWINQRDNSFAEFISIGDKKSGGDAIFEDYSLGIVTNRDAWCYNSSQQVVSQNVRSMIDFYNSQASLFSSRFGHLDKKLKADQVDAFVDNDPTKISWTRGLKQALARERKFEFEPDSLVRSIYRPFQKQSLYFNKGMNEMVLKMPRIFPKNGAKNRAIMVKGNWRGDGHFATMIYSVPCLQPDGGAQCFPIKLYQVIEDSAEDDLFGNSTSIGSVKEGDAITEAGLKHFQDAYPGEKITKEDLFYYVYGILHSEDYRTKYADNLSKELPRIPRVKTAADFWAFSRAGRELGDLHVNYETVEPYPVTIKQGDLRLADIKNPEAFYRVTKWAFGKAGKEKDKTTVIYNANITMQDVPLEAYDYVVNGKPALEWVMERQVVKTDKDSGIENDANRYAIETMGNPAYPLELFQRVITVSLRTMEIVRGLPKLEVM